MANPTSNFGWQMPTPTDLVTDLPADFEVFGQAVDTSMADLKGGTSGQILAKNSNTDMDFVWIANDQGDITGITASSPLTGGGTSGAITVGIQDALTTQKGAVQLSDSTSTTSSILAATPTAVKSAYDLANGAIAKSIVDAKGDLIVGTADDTVSRLAVGATNGHVLTVDSATATGIKWAAAAGGSSNPAFRAWRSGSQSISASTSTKIQFNAESFDTANCFDTSTYRFTPNVAGYYQVTGSAELSSSAGGYMGLFLLKNGTRTAANRTSPYQSGAHQAEVTDLVYLNGSTDYIELNVFINGGSSVTVNSGEDETYFVGVWVRS
jgi:hypothetical protein